MVSQIELYGIYYPKGLIQGDKGRIITTDSQVVVLSIEPDNKAKASRFRNYRDSLITSLDNLSKCKSK